MSGQLTPSEGGHILPIGPQEASDKREISDLTAWIKSSPPAEGFKEILYPGELEARTRKERLANGVPLDDTTWEEIQRLAEEYDVKTSLEALG